MPFWRKSSPGFLLLLVALHVRQALVAGVRRLFGSSPGAAVQTAPALVGRVGWEVGTSEMTEAAAAATAAAGSAPGAPEGADGAVPGTTHLRFAALYERFPGGSLGVRRLG